MGDVDEDLKRIVFANEASFIGGTIRRQWAVARDTLRMLCHNDTDDTILVGVSDDSLQVLKAGIQTITGAKTISNALLMSGTNQIQFEDSQMYIGSDGTDMKIGTDTEDMILSPTIDLVFQPNGTERGRWKQDGSLHINASNKIKLGTSNTFEIYKTGTTSTIDETVDDLLLDAGGKVTINSVGITEIEPTGALNMSSAASAGIDGTTALNLTSNSGSITMTANNETTLVMTGTTGNSAVAMQTGKGVTLTAAAAGYTSMTIPETGISPTAVVSNEVSIFFGTDGEIRMQTAAGEFTLDKTVAAPLV